MQTITTTATIDMCYEEDTLEEGVAAIEREFPGLKVNVVRATGTSCGWPEVTLTGEPTFLETVLRTAWDTGLEEENDLLVRAVLHHDSTAYGDGPA